MKVREKEGIEGENGNRQVKERDKGGKVRQEGNEGSGGAVSAGDHYRGSQESRCPESGSAGQSGVVGQPRKDDKNAPSEKEDNQGEGRKENR